MEAIVLAGGLGTRLRGAIGNDIPKCMAPINGHPFLHYLFIWLARQGVTRVILSVGHLREVIFAWVDEHRHEFPFEVAYAIEETPLGTGGGIRLAMGSVNGAEAVVVNGDTFFDVDLRQLLEASRSNETDITLALKPMRDFSRYGAVVTSADGHRVTAFREKQPCAEGVINGGVFTVRSDSGAFAHIHADKFSFEEEVLAPLASQDRVGCVVQHGYFIDIGIPEDYARAARDFKTIFT